MIFSGKSKAIPPKSLPFSEIFLLSPAPLYGEMSEWSIVHPWKGCVQQCTGGSNPPLSAIFLLYIMLDFLQKLMGKPSDTNIRIIRVVFALLLIFLIYFGWEVTAVNFGLPSELKYVLYIFPAVGLIRGIFDPGIFRKKIWKWTIFSLGIAMMVISLVFIEDVPLPSPADNTLSTASGTLDVTALASEPHTPFTVSTDNFFGIFGFFVAFIGFYLNNKNITKKNERYGEKVTKIRV